MHGHISQWVSWLRLHMRLCSLNVLQTLCACAANMLVNLYFISTLVLLFVGLQPLAIDMTVRIYACCVMSCLSYVMQGLVTMAALTAGVCT